MYIELRPQELKLSRRYSRISANSENFDPKIRLLWVCSHNPKLVWACKRPIFMVSSVLKLGKVKTLARIPSWCAIIGIITKLFQWVQPFSVNFHNELRNNMHRTYLQMYSDTGWSSGVANFWPSALFMMDTIKYVAVDHTLILEKNHNF